MARQSTKLSQKIAGVIVESLEKSDVFDEVGGGRIETRDKSTGREGKTSKSAPTVSEISTA